MYSDARGWLKIKSTNPFDKPAIQFNYLSTDQDRREWVEAVRVARNILTQPAMDEYNEGETSPGASVSTDEEVLDWVRKDAETALPQYEEIKNKAKELISENFAQYGQLVDDEQLETYAANVLKKQEEARRIQDELFLDKVSNYALENISVEEKEITIEEFTKLTQA
jgi:choline dehydrogenase-like flavoprotein